MNLYWLPSAAGTNQLPAIKYPQVCPVLSENSIQLKRSWSQPGNSNKLKRGKCQNARSKHGESEGRISSTKNKHNEYFTLSRGKPLSQQTGALQGFTMVVPWSPSMDVEQGLSQLCHTQPFITSLQSFINTAHSFSQHNEPGLQTIHGGGALTALWGPFKV